MSSPDLPQRKSPRLAGYSYTRPGAYFITICTHKRAHYLGQVADEKMHLSALGKIAHNELRKLPDYYVNVSLDGFVVMPNHVHAILILQDHSEQQPDLSHIVRSYKAGVTRTARHELEDVPSVLWQRRFHDHIIRNDAALSHIREYVQNNPLSWHLDTFNSLRESGQNKF